MDYFCSLYSGSTGNSLLYKNNCVILIDCGGSFKKLNESLIDLDLNFDMVNAILITHEHIDHINALKTASKRYRKPIYANKKTLEGIKKRFPDIDQSLFREIEKDKAFYINDIEIIPFNTCHDSADSMGYTLFNGKTKLGIATDIGKICSDVEKNLMECQKVLIESNHDVNMLMTNPKYPYVLKRRILSDFGHLSNEKCSNFITRLLNNKTDEFILGHLSRENNSPYLAFQQSDSALKCQGASEKDYTLSVADFDKISQKIFL